MKRILLLTISLIILSCSNDDSDEQNNNLINSFNVEQSSSELNFNYSSNSNFNYFEIAYTISTNSIDPSSADRFATNEQNSTSKSISELLIQTDILYSFWIRGFDANGNSTDWFGPRTISISEFCEDIYDLEFNGYIAWNYYNNDTEASYFQAQYGVQGFELGNGEIIQTNDETIWDVTLEQGNIYDVYVRANCENNLGFSQWIGPAGQRHRAGWHDSAHCPGGAAPPALSDAVRRGRRYPRPARRPARHQPPRPARG